VAEGILVASLVGVATPVGLEAGAGALVAVAPQAITKANKSQGKKAKRAVNSSPLQARHLLFLR
jgi:hypothetical protein